MDAKPVAVTTRCLFVLGGARSGKSRFAQAQAETSGLDPVFVATGQAYDNEMEERIARHQASRDVRWGLIEAPFDLAQVITDAARPGRILLVDCLTLWLTNILLRGDDVEAATRDLTLALAKSRGPTVIVSNEVGGGIVPDNALARRFRDAQGQLNQAVADVSATVVLVTAGLPLCLKPAPELRFRF